MSSSCVSAMNQSSPHNRAELRQYQRSHREICVAAHGMETTNFGQKMPVDSAVCLCYCSVWERGSVCFYGVCAHLYAHSSRPQLTATQQEPSGHWLFFPPVLLIVRQTFSHHSNFSSGYLFMCARI